MKNAFIKGSLIAEHGVEVTKETKDGKKTYLEFRIGDTYANFWGTPEPAKEYEYQFVPRDQAAFDKDPKTYNKGGLFRQVGTQRELSSIALDKVALKKATVIPVSNTLLALLTPSKKKAVATTEEDDD